MWQVLLKKVFDWLCSLDCDEMTVLWPNDCIILSFYYILFIWISNVTSFEKEVSDWMRSLDCDEITVLQPNDCITISYYYILFVRISNVTTFVKEVFWLDV